MTTEQQCRLGAGLLCGVASAVMASYNVAEGQPQGWWTKVTAVLSVIPIATAGL